jgi:hypothetical protein
MQPSVFSEQLPAWKLEGYWFDIYGEELRKAIDLYKNELTSILDAPV